jgi:hypothetical protein
MTKHGQDTIKKIFEACGMEAVITPFGGISCKPTPQFIPPPGVSWKLEVGEFGGPMNLVVTFDPKAMG